MTHLHSDNDESKMISEDKAKEKSESSNRRMFIKGAVVSFGAVVASEVAQKAVAAENTIENTIENTAPSQDKQMTIAQKGSLNGAVQVQFTQAQPKLEDLQNILAQIVRLNGCFSCGLSGIDIRFRLGDIKRLDIKAQVPANVTLERRF